MLTIVSQFVTGLGAVGLGYDSTRDEVLVYSAFGTSVNRFTTAGANVATFANPGETANDYDVDFVDAPLSLGGTNVAAGAAILINGESGVAEIRAVDPVSGAVLASLTTAFGASHVVGGAYHAARGTFFLVQDKVPGGTEANRVAEIDATTGAVLNSFVIPSSSGFTVNYGDLEVEPVTGELMVVSSDESSVLRMSPEGAVLGALTLPGVGGLAGIAFIPGSAGEAFVINTGGQVSRLSGFLGDGAIIGTDSGETLVGSVIGETIAALDGSDIVRGGEGDDRAYGGGGNDRLLGQGGNDQLYGDDGDDTLTGGLGDDVMAGGEGDDTYLVAQTGDVVIEAAGGGLDLVKASVDFTLADNIENLTLTGGARAGTGNGGANRIVGAAGDDSLSGLDGADVLTGRNGDDMLDGGAGADTLVGGNGKDVLTGGGGADLFRFDATGETARNVANADIITDFSQADGDRIALIQIDAIPATPTNDRFTFIGAQAFGGIAGQLRYSFSGGDTLVAGDTNGDGAADFTIRLTGQVALQQGDFTGVNAAQGAVGGDHLSGGWWAHHAPIMDVAIV